MRVLVFLVACMLPVQVAALSCIRPSVERSYAEAAAAKETYVIAQGRLTFNQRKLPRDGDGTRKPAKLTRIDAQLVGKSMTSNGFNVPFDHPVTLEVACYGPWCGRAENGGQVLAFLKRSKGGYALDINPCGGRAFANPKAKMLKQVVQCHKGGNCKTK